MNVINNIGNLLNLLQNITVSSVQSALVRAGIFLLSLTLVGIGFMIIARPSS